MSIGRVINDVGNGRSQQLLDFGLTRETLLLATISKLFAQTFDNRRNANNDNEYQDQAYMPLAAMGISPPAGRNTCLIQGQGCDGYGAKYDKANPQP